MTFTAQQIANWKRYEKVRLGGRWNMFFPQARAATGLSDKDYGFCMTHYEALRDAAQTKEKPNEQAT